MGATTPVGPLVNFVLSSRCRQWPRRRYWRVCLLKGCEQLFHPSHPLQRYCSPACREAARAWRRWRAGQRYRATDQGRQQRCAQSRRYRERQRLRRVATAAAPAIPEEPAPEPPALAEAAAPPEGQRDPQFLENFSGTSCRRPGCYVLFTPQPHYPPHSFCCAACRRALRRVLDREARWHRRRRLLRAGRTHPPPRG